ncbi:MAG: hypothetical protein J6U17_03600 [Kiritimatiellae bacterium]|nr:hypothetical protein [Kiritimatiellia bacterium]
MRREDINEIGLAAAIVLILLLIADAVWLHVRCARLEAVAGDLPARIERLENPPEDESFADKAANAYKRMKSAAVRGFEAARDEYKK